MLCKYNIGDNLKLILKFFALLIVGLLIAVIIYPFLHETGHSLLAMIFGAKIMDFQILPIPSVLLKMSSSISEFDFVLIGLSGMLLPYLISILLPAKTFWKWYVRIALRLICMLSFTMSIASILMYQKGSPMPNDDITIILQNFPQYMPFCFVILTLLLIVSMIMFVKDFVIFNKKKLYSTF